MNYKTVDVDESQILQTLERLKNSPLRPDSHLYPDYGATKIWDAVQDWQREIEAPENSPAIIFIRVVLSARKNYLKQVKPYVDKVIKQRPDLKSFDDLEKTMRDLSREAFYALWGHEDPRKFESLYSLLKAVHVLREKYKIQDDFELMNQWGKDIDLRSYESDVIGGIRNIGIATIQQLRMDFGINTVKPDQRVVEVLRREFGYKNMHRSNAIGIVEQMAELTGIDTRKLDLILVNYGSGYYDSRKLNAQRELRHEIAQNLLRLNVDKDTIETATGVRIDD